MSSALRGGLLRATRGLSSVLAVGVVPAFRVLPTSQRYYDVRLFSNADSPREGLTARDVQDWPAADIRKRLGTYLHLDDDDLAILEKQKISGKFLLGLSQTTMERVGLPVGAIETLLPFINKLRGTGEKTVYITSAADAEGKRLTFNDPEDLREFLRDQGASGLENGDGQGLIRASHYNRLKDGGKYTVSFVDGGFKTQMEQVRDYADSSAKAVVEKAEAAVVEQSMEVFGVHLTPHTRRDQLLKDETKRQLGDMDSLFTGDGLHVLMERKTRITSAGHALQVAGQMMSTADAYKAQGKHVVAGKECRVVSMVFADFIDSAAQNKFLEQGIYVLACNSDFKLYVATLCRL